MIFLHEETNESSDCVPNDIIHTSITELESIRKSMLKSSQAIASTSLFHFFFSPASSFLSKCSREQSTSSRTKYGSDWCVSVHFTMQICNFVFNILKPFRFYCMDSLHIVSTGPLLEQNVSISDAKKSVQVRTWYIMWNVCDEKLTCTEVGWRFQHPPTHAHTSLFAFDDNSIAPSSALLKMKSCVFSWSICSSSWRVSLCRWIGKIISRFSVCFVHRSFLMFVEQDENEELWMHIYSRIKF